MAQGPLDRAHREEAKGDPGQGEQDDGQEHGPPVRGRQRSQRADVSHAAPILLTLDVVVLGIECRWFGKLSEV